MRSVFKFGLTVLAALLTAGPPKAAVAEEGRPAPLLGTYVDRTLLPNPYAHIPAQCYIETSGGTQNACQYCHTNGPFGMGLGNNTPQAGASPKLGNLQEDYAFGALNHPFAPNGSRNPWTNTLFPGELKAELAKIGAKPDGWDMSEWIATDNWSPAFARRSGDVREWDAGNKDDFRLFPGLDPADLPASPEDGFVRSKKTDHGYFSDAKGTVTGWRAVNFFPYGLFTPHAGSVSGIYIRLPKRFMQDEKGRYDINIYAENLDLLAMTVQGRLDKRHGRYKGAAADTEIEPGLYPQGTEFAHPLHYVDVLADGGDPKTGPFPGTRAKRVKEIRFMYKLKSWYPDYGGPHYKDESGPVYGSETQGWADNGAGWLLAGFIEDKDGQLRPQTLSELTQCLGCHSGNSKPSEKGYENFSSGTGNTIDSTWSLPRAYPGQLGWREMDYLGYRAKPQAKDDETPGTASRGDAVNRMLGRGELRHFLESVVGLSLYGDMPGSVERFLSTVIRKDQGYAGDWPALDLSSAKSFLASQNKRQSLLRAMTEKGGHLAKDGTIRPELLYPPRGDSLAAAKRYRQVVVTQRYDFGKDVFDDTPVSFRYFRPQGQDYTHQNGQPYQEGEIVTDRPVDPDPASLTYGNGIAKTLIGDSFYPDYVPLLDFPGQLK